MATGGPEDVQMYKPEGGATTEMETGEPGSTSSGRGAARYFHALGGDGDGGVLMSASPNWAP